MNKYQESLIGLNTFEIQNAVLEDGYESYRAEQLYHWIYNQNIQSIDEMSNVPKALREHLNNNYLFNPLNIIHSTGDENSHTQKYLLKCVDGERIESVLMKEGKRTTICLSSQVGCALGCKFCATGTMGIIRNLTAGEIVGQYLLLLNDTSETITNVVFMGMGEPFLNYDNVLKAANLLNDANGINIGAKHITISTAGVLPGIKKFIEEKQRYKLAISLNSSNQEQRTQIMPIAKKYKLDKLIDAAHSYYNSTRNFITFEYVLMSGINDSREDANNIIKLINDLPCKLNVIPYNEIGSKINRPTGDRIKEFLNSFDNVPFTVTTRWSKGSDINAGCGQLVVNR